MTEQDLILLRQVRDEAKSGGARRVRLDSGLSQAEIAEVVGIHQSTLALWESGRRRPHGDCALRYARLLRLLASER